MLEVRSIISQERSVANIGLALCARLFFSWRSIRNSAVMIFVFELAGLWSNLQYAARNQLFSVRIGGTYANLETYLDSSIQVSKK